MMVVSYSLKEKEAYKLKTDNTNTDFPTQFRLRKISGKLD